MALNVVIIHASGSIAKTRHTSVTDTALVLVRISAVGVLWRIMALSVVIGLVSASIEEIRRSFVLRWETVRLRTTVRVIRVIRGRIAARHRFVLELVR